MRLLIIALAVIGICQGQEKWQWTPEAGWINSRYDPRAVAKVLHDKAKLLMSKRKYAKAIATLRLAVEKYPNTPEGKDALYLIAECLYSAGDYYQAYLFYQKYREKYPASPRLQEVLKKEYDIGTTLIRGKGFLVVIHLENKKLLIAGKIPGDLRKAFIKNGYSLSNNLVLSTMKENKKWLLKDDDFEQNYLIFAEKDEIKVYRKDRERKTLGIFSKDSAQLGIEIVKKVIESSPYANYADDAQLTIANYYFRLADYEAAQDAYLKLFDDYPNSEWIKIAQYQMAMCSFLQYRNPFYDREPLLIADQKLKRYFSTYKNEGAKIDQKAELLKAQVRDKRAKKEFEVAMFYLDRDDITSAKIYLYTIVKEFSKTPTAVQAQEILRGLKASDS